MIKQIKSDSAYKDMQTTHKSSERSSSTSGESHSQPIQKKFKSRTNRDIIHSKSGVCNAMRAKFYSVAQEAGFCLQDKMEILMNLCENTLSICLKRIISAGCRTGSASPSGPTVLRRSLGRPAVPVEED
nr:coiled-coil domain containing 60 [Rousettus aegyptiacus]